jgi:cytochrome c-type biogenesis protein
VLENQVLLARISGGIIIHVRPAFSGHHSQFPMLHRELRVDAGDQGADHPLAPISSALPSPLAGRPASGPQLGAILSLAMQEGSMERGTILLGVYALGLGLPFLIWRRFSSRNQCI